MVGNNEAGNNISSIRQGLPHLSKSVYSWTNSKMLKALSPLVYCYVFTLLSSLKCMHNHSVTIYAVMTMTILSREEKLM